MQFRSLAVALLAAAPVAQAAEAIINNMCKEAVYLWSVTADGSDGPILIQPGNNYTEPYKTPSIGGVSLKLSLDEDCTNNISQFEYTLKGDIWYDLSNVNCLGANCPFLPYGMYMASGNGCPTRACPIGQDPCTGAYNKFNDDWNTLSCDSQNDIVLWLCSESDPAQQKRSVPAAPEEFGALQSHRLARRHSHHLHHPHARR